MGAETRQLLLVLDVRYSDVMCSRQTLRQNLDATTFEVPIRRLAYASSGYACGLSELKGKLRKQMSPIRQVFEAKDDLQ